MCWENDEWYHCHECQIDWNQVRIRTPCFAVQNGRPCPGVTEREPVVIDWETCESCKEVRAAEEACQQIVHKQQPLVFEFNYLRRRIWLRETYRHSLEFNRGPPPQKNAKAKPKVKPSMVTAPPFVTSRTQPDTGGPRV
ncbi:hypothetical protein AAE478_006270 [Parahypoxylon ruwenzoriense]